MTLYDAYATWMWISAWAFQPIWIGALAYTIRRYLGLKGLPYFMLKR